MINIPVSVGELVDKITILKIKLTQIKDEDKLINVQKEHDALTSLHEYVRIQKVVLNQQQQLMKVNLCLWFLEEDIRRYEKKKFFESAFIDAARKIYKTNDERSRIKKEINILCNSELVEEKSHED
jgi:phosphoribosylaminoimidazole carboxylase (NCAIR synthetase)